MTKDEREPTQQQEAAAALALAASRVNLCLHYEQRLLERNARQRRLPVTIVSGFLGAGKTSLLRHVLANRLNLRLACAVSDLAAINVDALLVSAAAATGGSAGDPDPSASTSTSASVFALEPRVVVDPNARRGPAAATALMRRRNEHRPEVFGLMSRAGPGAVEDVIWRALQETEAPFDYLLVETSGTTDPTALIASVQARFGRMTRARLDSVVVVVDGDALVAEARAGRSPNAIALHQLACADVVVLNKIDLLAALPNSGDHGNDARAEARAVLRRYAPGARVLEAEHGQVYLPHVLDIAPPEGIHEAVSHEKVTPHWICGDDRAARRLRVQDAPMDTSSSSASSAPAAVAFQSVAVELAAPHAAVALSQLHEYIHRHLPPGTLRAKGVVQFAEDPTQRYVVQLSGNRRLEIENTGRWLTVPKTQFVVIGADFAEDEATIRGTLESILSRAPGDDDHDASNSSSNGSDACLARLREDPRFELVPSHTGPTAVCFRLTLPLATVSDAAMRHYHHIDRNDLIRRLIHEVNALGGGALLLPVVVPGDEERPVVAAMASCAGPTTLLDMWPALDARAAIILKEIREKLAACMCGF